MTEKISGLKFSKLVLYLIATVGGVLVAENVISGEQLVSIQNITGMLASGGSLTALVVIKLLIDVIPKSTAKNIVEKVGVTKIEQVFTKVDDVVEIVQVLRAEVNNLTSQLELERQAKIELGVYDTVSQELKDKLL